MKPFITVDVEMEKVFWQYAADAGPFTGGGTDALGAPARRSLEAMGVKGAATVLTRAARNMAASAQAVETELGLEPGSAPATEAAMLAALASFGREVLKK